MKKLILILGAILCIGCSAEDDCREERQMQIEAYDRVLENENLGSEQRVEIRKARQKWVDKKC